MTLQQTGWQIHACLISNFFHLVLDTLGANGWGGSGWIAGASEGHSSGRRGVLAINGTLHCAEVQGDYHPMGLYHGGAEFRQQLLDQVKKLANQKRRAH